jgi:ribosomal 50S subunit-associated protein YjgA (DUF615 family)
MLHYSLLRRHDSSVAYRRQLPFQGRLMASRNLIDAFLVRPATVLVLF